MKIKKGYVLSAVLIAILCAFAIYSYNAYQFKKASRDILYQLSSQLIVKQGLEPKSSTHLVLIRYISTETYPKMMTKSLWDLSKKTLSLSEQYR